MQNTTLTALRFVPLLAAGALLQAACQPSPSQPGPTSPVASISVGAANTSATTPVGPPRIVLQVDPLEPPTAIAISPDGNLVAARSGAIGTQTGLVCSTTVWDVRTAEVRGVIRACKEDLRFSPDGRTALLSPFLWGQGGSVSMVEAKDKEPMKWQGFSSDGAWAASSHGNVVRLWNTRTSSRQATLTLGGAVSAVALGQTKAGAVVAVADASQPAITIWDVSTGKQRTQIAGHASSPAALRFARDGSLLVIVSSDGAIRTWEAESGKTAALQGSPVSQVRTVHFSPDGQRLALVVPSTPTAAVQIGDLRTGRIDAPVAIPEARTRLLAFSPDGEMLAFAGNHDMGVWSIRERREVASVAIGSPVLTMTWTRGGAGVEAHAGDKVVRWDRGSSKVLAPIPLGEGSGTARVAWDPTGRFRLHVYRDTARVWDVEREAPVRSLDLATGKASFAFSGPTDPRGTRIAWPAGNGLAIWDLSSGQVQTTTVGREHGNLVYTSWSHDGSVVAAIGPGGYVSVVRPGVEVAVGTQGRKPQEGVIQVEASLSVNGELLLLPDAASLQVFDTVKGMVPMTIPTATSGIFSADGKRVVVRDDFDPEMPRFLRLWDVEQGKYLWSRQFSYVGAPAPFSPDGAWVLLRPHDINEPLKLEIVNSTTGKNKAGLSGCSFMSSGQAAWSPKGVLVAQVTACGVNLWDGRAERALFSVDGEHWPETSVALAWSPDGVRLATSFGVFDVQSGARVAFEPREGPLPKGFTWAQDGKTVLALNDDSTAVVYDAVSGRVLRAWEGIESVTILHGGKLALVRKLELHEPTELWRLSDGAILQLATLNLRDEGVGWVAWGADGRFDGSPNALQRIRIRMGDSLTGGPMHGPGPVMDRLRAPGLVAEFLAGAQSSTVENLPPPAPPLGRP